MLFLTYLSDIVQEAAGRYQEPWALSPVPVSVIFLVMRSIIFSIYVILTFLVSSSEDSDSLDSLSFLRVALNSWVSDHIDFFTFDALV